MLQASRYKAAYGGRDSGKSWHFASMIVEHCLFIASFSASRSSSGSSITDGRFLENSSDCTRHSRQAARRSDRSQSAIRRSEGMLPTDQSSRSLGVHGGMIAKRAFAEASALRLSYQRASVPLSDQSEQRKRADPPDRPVVSFKLLARVLPPIPIRNPDTAPPPSTPTPTPTTPIPAPPIPAACLCGRASGSVDRGS